MYLIISHSSALAYWHRFRGPIDRLPRVRQPKPMDHPIPLDGRIREELAEAGFAPDKEHPLDLLFSRHGVHSQAAGIRAHCPRRPLPNGSLLRLSEHVAIASPELCFAQIAAGRTTGRLILDGCEMCGTYVPATAGDTPEERLPLTSAATLRAFLGGMGLGREAKALRAARVVFDGAASPMEAKLGLLLSLPQSMGGFGLPRPVLNAPVVLGAAARRVYPHKSCRMDLSWPGTNLAVEYDGRLHDEDRRDRDNARLVAIRMEGVDVLVLRRQQVYDARGMLGISATIAAKLGRRLRRTTKDFWTRHRQLRRELEL